MSPLCDKWEKNRAGVARVYFLAGARSAGLVKKGNIVQNSNAFRGAACKPIRRNLRVSANKNIGIEKLFQMPRAVRSNMHLGLAFFEACA
jgi:hypothetical protein